jgi:signal transduction histidine kinase
VIGHPLLLAAHAVGGIAYAVAALAFTHQSARRPDPLVRWLAAACALAAFSRVNYLLFPSLYSDFVYTGDLLRFGFYVLLLVGGAREVQSFWQARAHAAVLEERRRLARDLHDGLTQELAYLWTQSRRLAAHPDDRQAVERIGGAAARALDEARGAIAALTQTTDAGFAAVLEQAADGLASRYDASVAVDVAPDVRVSPEQGDALLRIVAEAFRNAVLHGGARTVTVRVRMPLSLEVSDDGTGFDAEAARSSSGFGVTSMRERAEALGASFSLSSGPGHGALVTVRWPDLGSNRTRHPRE